LLGRSPPPRRTEATTARADRLLAGPRLEVAGIDALEPLVRAASKLDRAAPGRATGTLTPAERRVAGLVAEGRRNREIGQLLFMSVGTVEGTSRAHTASSASAPAASWRGSSPRVEPISS
jgi:hypothetical protein